MNKSLVAMIVSVAALFVCAIAWFLPPLLQDARHAVGAEASVELERARRLLDKYDATLTYKTFLADELAEQDIEVDPGDLSEDVEDEYQQIHTSLWESYPPVDWRDDTPRTGTARYGDIPGQIRQGLDRVDRLVRENERFLDDALTAVNRALSVTKGDASSRSHAEATRLKAAIFFHKGLIRQVEAQLKRRECNWHYRTVAALANGAAESVAMRTLVESSRIDDRIDAVRANVAEFDASLAKDRKALAALDARIGDLEARFLAADARATEALRTMEWLKAEGIDFSEPNGAETFQASLLEQDRIHRKAARETHALRYGTYPYAQIDRSADYLAGQYVEGGSATDLTIEHGLAHFQRARAVLAAKIERQQEGINALRTDIARLEEIKGRHQATESRVAQDMAAVATAASDVHAELNRIESEAYVIEDEALTLFDQSLRSAKQAAGHADRWLRDARDHTEGLSSEARQRSAFASRLNDRWMGGYMAAQEADARLAKARVYHTRFRTATQNADLLGRVAQPLQLTEVDVEAEKAKAQEAHDAGLAEIATAMDVLESVHGKTDRHWTITAQAATANDLLAQFGHEDYADDALTAYRAAVENRQDQASAAPFVTRISRLENR